MVSLKTNVKSTSFTNLTQNDSHKDMFTDHLGVQHSQNALPLRQSRGEYRIWKGSLCRPTPFRLLHTDPLPIRINILLCYCQPTRRLRRPRFVSNQGLAYRTLYHQVHTSCKAYTSSYSTGGNQGGTAHGQSNLHISIYSHV